MADKSDKWLWFILLIPITIVFHDSMMTRNSSSVEVSTAVQQKISQQVNETIPGYRVVSYRKELSSPCAMNERGMTFVAAPEKEDGIFMKDHIVLGIACLKDSATDVSSVYIDTNVRR
jgi:hypothetical protein